MEDRLALRPEEGRIRVVVLGNSVRFPRVTPRDQVACQCPSVRIVHHCDILLFPVYADPGMPPVGMIVIIVHPFKGRRDCIGNLCGSNGDLHTEFIPKIGPHIVPVVGLQFLEGMEESTPLILRKFLEFRRSRPVLFPDRTVEIRRKEGVLVVQFNHGHAGILRKGQSRIGIDMGQEVLCILFLLCLDIRIKGILSFVMVLIPGDIEVHIDIDPALLELGNQVFQPVQHFWIEVPLGSVLRKNRRLFG